MYYSGFSPIFILFKLFFLKWFFTKLHALKETIYCNLFHIKKSSGFAQRYQIPHASTGFLIYKRNISHIDDFMLTNYWNITIS